MTSFNTTEIRYSSRSDILAGIPTISNINALRSVGWVVGGGVLTDKCAAVAMEFALISANTSISNTSGRHKSDCGKSQGSGEFHIVFDFDFCLLDLRCFDCLRI